MSPLRAGESDYSFRVGKLTIHDLGVVSVKATEAISRPFQVRLDLACEDRELDLNEIVGKPGTLRISNVDPEQDRFFNGIVSRFEYMGEGVRFARYECDLVPFIWLLDLRLKSRIFQEMSSKEIIEQVMTDAGMRTDMWDMVVTKEYAKREYCVQYRESDLTFIHRLMEEEGIFYFFKHTEEDHVMVIGDSPEAHVAIGGEADVVFREASAMVEGAEFISHFRLGHQVRPGAVMLRDFKFEEPKLNLQFAEKGDRDQTLEMYDYPGEYYDEGTGKRLAKVRLEELQASRKVGRAVSACRRMIPGFRFTLADHVRPDFNSEYLITSVTHTGTQPETLEQEPGGGTVPPGPIYENSFTCIPYAVPFRPLRLTPRPLICGTQTAIVVGPSGEEIHTDEHGRVKVHFHWDREGVFDDKASCWIRVAQGWAGGKYGMMFIPRISHEVVVDFLEGDPDKPIIVGSVYNGDEQPPYALPDEKTKSTIRTANSTGQDGAHEIRFEDKKGEEQIFIHSEKDLHIRAKNDRLTNIMNDSHETIDGESRVKITKSLSLDVGGDMAVAIGGQLSEKVTGDVLQDFKANHQEKTASSYELKAGTSIKLDAGSTIEIKVGGNSIVLCAAGIFIVGTMVNINSGSGPPAPPVVGSLASPAKPEESDEESPGQDTSYTGEARQQEAIESEALEPKSWIEVELKDDQGKPVPGEAYLIKTTDGKEISGTLDVNGKAKVQGIDPGSCKIYFPNRSKEEVKRG